MAERTTPGTRVALTIADSDSSGGAGIQGDLKTFTVMNVYGVTVITAITAQNTTGVKTSKVLDPELIEKQIEAIASDIDVHGVKTGMLGCAEVIHTVARAVQRHNLFPLVIDPVMVGKSGDSLIDDAAVRVLCRNLLPLAAVATPNRFEAARMLGRAQPIEDLWTAQTAAKELCKKFKLAACIVKGIKRPNDEEGEAVDVYFDGQQEHELVSNWRPTQNTHGAGSTFSAAITAGLALGQPIDQAIQTAKKVISEAIRQTTDLGHGSSPVNPMAYAKVS